MEGKSEPVDTVTSLSPSFRAFLEANRVDADAYLNQLTNLAPFLPRYVRINPRNPLSEAGIAHQLPSAKPTPVPGLYELPRDFPLSKTHGYKAGQLAGLDLPSVIAVLALGVKPGDRVLDLCCAPGAKLCMLADAVLGPTVAAPGASSTSSASPPLGSVTGVDISRQRLGACLSLLEKYRARQVRLFVADGTTFDERPPPVDTPLRVCTISQPPSATTTRTENGKQRTKLSRRERKLQRAAKRANASATAAEAGRKRKASGDDDEMEQEEARPGKRQRLDTAGSSAAGGEAAGAAPRDNAAAEAKRKEPEVSDSGLYDKVLVDAECTHDGSMQHVLKTLKSGGWPAFDASVLEPSRLAALPRLQGALLANGFRLLRPGGTLVYATCSACPAQNEDIVETFLKQHPGQAELLPIASTGSSETSSESRSSSSNLLLPWLSVREAGCEGSLLRMEKEPAVAVAEEGREAPAGGHAAAVTAPSGAHVPQSVVWAERGLLEHTLRFCPGVSRTSGLFIAKLRKVPQPA